MAWRISLTPPDLRRLRDDPALPELLTLGRVANILRSALAAGRVQERRDDSASERARVAMTLLLTGIVAEALPLLERSGKYFRDLPAFSSHVRPILGDDGLRDLKAKWLAPVRNQAVFHNDAVVSERGLSALDEHVEFDIARGSTAGHMDVYYPLADLVAVAYMIEAGGSASDPRSFLMETVGPVIQLAGRICTAIDTLLGQALAARGLTWHDLP